MQQPQSPPNPRANQERNENLRNSRNSCRVSLDTPKQKDPKSLTQNLFDTTVVDKLFDAHAPVHRPASFSSRKHEKIAEETQHKRKDKEFLDKADSKSVTSSNRTEIDQSYADKPQLNSSSLHDSKLRQTLSHFSLQNVKALVSAVQKSFQEKVKREHSGRHSLLSANQTVPADVSILSFAQSSISYIFTTPQALQASFREEALHGDTSGRAKPIDFGCMIQSFCRLNKIDTRYRLVMSSLSTATKGLHVAQDAMKQYVVEVLKKDKTASKTSIWSSIGAENTNPEENHFRGVNDQEAAHVTMLAFAALVAIVPPCSLEIWDWVYKCHQSGRIVPRTEDIATNRSLQTVLDAFEDEAALDLLSKLCKALAGRLYVSRAERHFGRQEELDNNADNVIERLISHVLGSQRRPVPYYCTDRQTGGVQLRWTHDSLQPDKGISARSPEYFDMMTEWLRYFIIKNWDGQTEIDRFSAVGGALEILYQFSRLVDIPVDFRIMVMAARFDFLKTPAKWLEHQRIGNPAHLLDYPFVFNLYGQISCFRGINYARMLKSYEDTVLASRLLKQMAYTDTETGRGAVRVKEKLHVFLQGYFVIEVTRENVLLDALNQLWRREKREMMKPLKVRMGMDEGEQGVDHGGVQQEFFRIVIGEVLNPEYGMFTIDEQSKMAWFRPCSLEPLYKFELVGLLFSLAIYNGLTLPVNFPLAFYRKLQGYHITNPRQIADGWPVLAKGLQSLLDWSEGDVADVFARTYEFTAEGPGLNITVDMQKVDRTDSWVPGHLHPEYIFESEDGSETPEAAALDVDSNETKSEKVTITTEKGSTDQSPKAPDQPTQSSEPAMVTNTNRKQYVSDYIFWLTDKSIRPQFQAFADNFFTCISTRAPGILSVHDFKRLVEGTQDINVEDLKGIADYADGYAPDHNTIRDFWATVDDFSPEQLRLLLEFVTACNRIPAMGAITIPFTVVRSGDGDERLPTSSTCYGKLLLPEYSCREVLRDKLSLAIENCKGFGVP